MDESELTRKAIEEIMREMNLQQEADKLPQIRERKLNPLGKPNKDFLDRTINSVMTHNKRQMERNHRICQNKLKDMDEAKASREHTKRHSRERHRTKVKRKRRYSDSSSTSSKSRSVSSASSKEKRSKHKKSKKKKKRNKKKAISRSSPSASSKTSSLSIDSSSSSSISTKNNKKLNRKRKISVNEDNEQDYENRQNIYPYNEELAMGYYVDPNMAFAAMAYTHMNQLLQQQQSTMQAMVKEELEGEDNGNESNKTDIPSDLSLTYHSAESELNISLNSSSAEEDENGVLTFKLTSDEEHLNRRRTNTSIIKKKILTKTRRKTKKSQSSSANEITLSDSSTGQVKNTSLHKETTVGGDEITIISSSLSSESEQEVIKASEHVTTIISSSSESDDAAATNEQEEITLLSSCTSSVSSATEEDAGSDEEEKGKVTVTISQNSESPSSVKNFNEEESSKRLCDNEVTASNEVKITNVVSGGSNETNELSLEAGSVLNENESVVVGENEDDNSSSILCSDSIATSQDKKVMITSGQNDIESQDLIIESTTLNQDDKTESDMSKDESDLINKDEDVASTDSIAISLDKKVMITSGQDFIESHVLILESIALNHDHKTESDMSKDVSDVINKDDDVASTVAKDDHKCNILNIDEEANSSALCENKLDEAAIVTLTETETETTSMLGEAAIVTLTETETETTSIASSSLINECSNEQKTLTESAEGLVFVLVKEETEEAKECEDCNNILFSKTGDDQKNSAPTSDDSPNINKKDESTDLEEDQVIQQDEQKRKINYSLTENNDIEENLIHEAKKPSDSDSHKMEIPHKDKDPSNPNLPGGRDSCEDNLMLPNHVTFTVPEKNIEATAMSSSIHSNPKDDKDIKTFSQSLAVQEEKANAHDCCSTDEVLDLQKEN